MKQFAVERDITSIPLYITEFAEDIYSARLAADTDTTLAVPATADYALISASDYYLIKADGAITMPTVGAGFTKTEQEQNKSQLRVSGITTLHFRARNAMDITVAFYRE